MPSWRVEPQRVTGSWHTFRQVSPNWPPLYHDAGEAVPGQESGRWHRQGEGYVQYLSMSPHGAWAECIRYFEIRSADRAAELRRNLWLAILVEAEIADLSTFDRWVECGLDPKIAVGSHARSQDVADDLRAAGYRGVLSPSAALPGATNLSLFGERYELILRGDLAGLHNPDPQMWLPCELTAERAAAPAEVTLSTCFEGMKHLGYEQWVAASAGS